jgi:hypothetical protein
MSQQWFQTFWFASRTLSNSEHTVFGAFGFACFLRGFLRFSKGVDYAGVQAFQPEYENLHHDNVRLECGLRSPGLEATFVVVKACVGLVVRALEFEPAYMYQ